MDKEPKQTKPCSYPHESKHVHPQTRADIQSGLAGDHVPENDEHSRRNDGRGRSQQRSNEGPDGDREAPPAGEEHDGRDEDGDEVHAHACQKEAEHEMAREPDQAQDVVDICGEGDGCPGQQFVEKDLDGIEPVESGGFRAIDDALGVVALAEIPEADLVEIVEAEGAC